MKIFNIVKKEFDKIFRFPRMIFTTLLMPGMIIFLVYAFIGQSLESEMTKSNEHYSVIHVIDQPQSFDFVKTMSESMKLNLNESQSDELTSLQDSLKEGKIDAIIVFEEDFDNKVNLSYPLVSVYFNTNETNSNIARQKIDELLEIQRTDFLEKLSINPNIINKQFVNHTDETNSAGMILGMILPLLIMSFIFSSALSIGSDAIAGEKERGTLATLLMAPIKRNEIIFGKILSTTLITLLAAISSFLGVVASLPFAKSMFGVDGSTINYTVFHYLGIIGILLVLSFLASSILLITSTIAKSVKEASMYSMPIYLIAVLVPAMSIFSTDIDGFGKLFIPIYNCTLGFKGLFSMTLTLNQYLVIIGSSLAYIILAILLLMKLFKNENVLFSK